MVNRENILRVAQAIEDAAKADAKPKIGFNMADWISQSRCDRTGHACETVACIAGWARVVETGNPQHKWSLWEDDVTAAQFLGLDNLVADHLFRGPMFLGEDLDKITPAHAATVLRRLAETGTVDWAVSAAVPA